MQSVYHLGKSEEESPRVPTTFVKHEKLYTIYGTICIVSIRRKSFLSLPSSSAFFALVARLHFTSRFLLLCCCSFFITFDTHTQKHAHSYTHTQKMPQNYSEKTCRRTTTKSGENFHTIILSTFCVHCVSVGFERKRTEKKSVYFVWNFIRILISCGKFVRNSNGWKIYACCSVIYLKHLRQQCGINCRKLFNTTFSGMNRTEWSCRLANFVVWLYFSLCSCVSSWFLLFSLRFFFFTRSFAINILVEFQLIYKSG